MQAAWAAIRVRGRLQAQYNRLVRRFGGEKNPGAKKKAITAIAHRPTLRGVPSYRDFRILMTTKGESQFRGSQNLVREG